MHYNFQTKKGIAISAIVKLPQMVQKTFEFAHAFTYEPQRTHFAQHFICNMFAEQVKSDEDTSQ